MPRLLHAGIVHPIRKFNGFHSRFTRILHQHRGLRTHRIRLRKFIVARGPQHLHNAHIVPKIHLAILHQLMRHDIPIIARFRGLRNFIINGLRFSGRYKLRDLVLHQFRQPTRTPTLTRNQPSPPLRNHRIHRTIHHRVPTHRIPRHIQRMRDRPAVLLELSVRPMPRNRRAQLERFRLREQIHIHRRKHRIVQYAVDTWTAQSRTALPQLIHRQHFTHWLAHHKQKLHLHLLLILSAHRHHQTLLALQQWRKISHIEIPILPGHAEVQIDAIRGHERHQLIVPRKTQGVIQLFHRQLSFRCHRNRVQQHTGLAFVNHRFTGFK